MFSLSGSHFPVLSDPTSAEMEREAFLLRNWPNTLQTRCNSLQVPSLNGFVIKYLWSIQVACILLTASRTSSGCMGTFWVVNRNEMGASTMTKQAGVDFWGFKFVFVLLAASTAFLCQSASATAVNCSNGPGRSCVVQSHVADNSSGLHDFASFRALARDSDMTRMTGDHTMILPGPQLFKRPSSDVEFQTQLAGTQPLPEPSTIVLLSMGLLGIASSLRRIH